jgi:hypothetical protein
MTMHQPTRRAMIGAIAALPAIGMAGQVHATPGTDSVWAALVADYQKARQHMKHVGKAFDAAERRLAALRPDKPLPPKAPALFNPDGTHNSDALQRILRGSYKADYNSYEQACEAWTAECARIRADVLDKLEKEWEAAVDATGTAAKRVLAYPVTSVEQLADKLAILTKEYHDFGSQEGEMAAVIADVDRLARRA